MNPAIGNNFSSDNEMPLVDICLYTYNHEKYISEAIESVLMQQTNFNYRIIIGEDCSTDNTRAICVEYQKKYPEKIVLILQEKNLGAINNSFIVHNTCTSKYVAILEGDDFWTDPLKLQKQVDFMENNATSAACFHKAQSERVEKIENEKLSYSIEDVIALPSTGWVIMTSTIMYRKKAVGTLPLWLLKLKVGDWPIIMLASINGTIDFINETMSNYRVNPTSLMHRPDYSTIKIVHYLIQLFHEFNKYTNYTYKYQIYKQLLFLLYQAVNYYKSEKNWYKYFIQKTIYNHYKIKLRFKPDNLKMLALFLFNYPLLIFKSI